MDQQDIQQRTEKIVREQCFSHPTGTKIEQSTPIRGTGGLCFDSLEEVELLMALEEEFELSISDEDAEKINTFGEGVAYLTKRLAEETAAA